MNTSQSEPTFKFPADAPPPDEEQAAAEHGSGRALSRARQVAFYPNMKSSNKPQKPFSRSAAKRESVMALGSIEYLQHYFTKTGIAAESECVFSLRLLYMDGDPGRRLWRSQ